MASLTRLAFSLVHGAYLRLPGGLRSLVRKYRPLALRELVRGRMMPVLHGRAAAPVVPAVPAARDAPRGPLAPGLTVAGFLAYSLGLGEAGRALLRACMAADIPVNTINVELSGRHPHEGPLPNPRRPGDAPREAALICVNADYMQVLPPHLAQAARAGQYRIGHWYWELEKFPSAWHDSFDAVDELWAASPFIRDNLAAVSPRPVLYMPPPVEVCVQGTYRRADFGLPEDRFLFLFSYDFDSFVARKNPHACIEAFQRAFAAHEDGVALAIKTLHAERYPEQRAMLLEIARADPRVHLLDLNLSRDQSYGLIGVCDSYLSLHRAEGFGLGMAEAMVLRKPVVATGYSGNLAFMNADNSCLVGYRMVPLREGDYPYFEGQSWAEPDLDDAARHMRRLAGDAQYCAELGARAARHMAEHFSAPVIGARIKRRLGAIHAWRARGP